MKKYLLTSFAAMLVASPAMAAAIPWPSDGLMLNNKEYENAATKAHMGVDSGIALAEAYYNIDPGYYLPANSYTAALCTANSYCTGRSGVMVSSSAQGITGTCPTGYPKSASGASSSWDCYRTCTASDVQHAASGATFSGGVYKSNINKCVPSACEDGYTPQQFNLMNSVGGVGWTAVSESGVKTGSDSTYAAKDAHFEGALVNGDFVVFSGADGTVELRGKAACGVDTDTLVYSSDPTPMPSNAQSGEYEESCFCKLTNYPEIPSSYITGEGALRSVWIKAASKAGVSGTCSQTCAQLCAMNFVSMDGGADPWGTELVDKTAYASKCVPYLYKVHYKCGPDTTGTAPGGSQGFDTRYNTQYTMEANTCESVDGYTFGGWSDGQSTPAIRKAGDSFAWQYKSNITFTAVWNGNPIIIYWDENGGSTVARGECTYGGDLTLGAAPTKDGYNFAGWKMNAETALAAANSTIEGGCIQKYIGVTSGQSRNVIVAQWTGKQITIDYNENGGSSIANGTCTYGQNFTLPAGPTKQGYTFKKWVLADGSTKEAGASVKCISTYIGTKESPSTGKIIAEWEGVGMQIRWTGYTSQEGGDRLTDIVYGGNIVTPTTKPNAKAGMVFRGWKFSSVPAEAD